MVSRTTVVIHQCSALTVKRWTSVTAITYSAPFSPLVWTHYPFMPDLAFSTFHLNCEYASNSLLLATPYGLAVHCPQIHVKTLSPGCALLPIPQLYSYIQGEEL